MVLTIMPLSAGPRSFASSGRTPAKLNNVKTGELAALREENDLLRAVIDNFPGGILLYDRNLKLVLCNEQQKKLLGYPPNLFEYGLPSLEQIFRFNAIRGEYGPGDIETHVKERMALAAKREAHIFERTRPNGTVLEVRGVPLEGGGFLTTYLDVTRQRGAAPKQTPETTAVQLPDWNSFQERLDQALANSRRSGVVAIHYIDIDNFRQVTQKLGTLTGDRLIELASGRLRSVVRGTDAVTRCGDDEFLILQTEINRPSDVARLAHRLVDSIRAPFEIDRYVITVGAGIGIALAPRDGFEAEDLLAKAKDALYRARKEAPERVELTDDEHLFKSIGQT